MRDLTTQDNVLPIRRNESRVQRPGYGHARFGPSATSVSTTGSFALCLLVVAAVLFAEEESLLASWLFGENSGVVSKVLKVSIWAAGALCTLWRFSIPRPFSTSLACLYAMAAAILGTSLLTGSSLRFILTDTLFIPVTILALTAAADGKGKSIIIISLFLIAVGNLLLIVFPPESLTEVKAATLVAARSYGTYYSGDIEAGSTGSGMYSYETYSGALCIVGLLLLTNAKFTNTIKIPLALGFVFGGFISMTRAAYLGGIVGIVVAAFLRSGSSASTAERVLKTLGATLLVSALCVGAWQLVPGALREGMSKRLSDEKMTTGVEQRMNSTWGVMTGIKAIARAPILGSGIRDKSLSIGTDDAEIAPHNPVVGVGARHGIPAMILLAVLLWKAWSGLLKSYQASSAGRERNVNIGILSGFSGYCVVSMVNPGYGTLIFWVMASLGLAFWESQPVVGRWKAKAPGARKGRGHS
jgi:hypothetical protein